MQAKLRASSSVSGCPPVDARCVASTINAGAHSAANRSPWQAAPHIGAGSGAASTSSRASSSADRSSAACSVAPDTTSTSAGGWDGDGGWDGRRVVLERLERGALRGAVAQALGHGFRGEVHAVVRGLVGGG